MYAIRSYYDTSCTRFGAGLGHRRGPAQGEDSRQADQRHAGHGERTGHFAPEPPAVEGGEDHGRIGEGSYNFV